MFYSDIEVLLPANTSNDVLDNVQRVVEDEFQFSSVNVRRALENEHISTCEVVSVSDGQPTPLEIKALRGLVRACVDLARAREKFELT